MIDMTTFCGSEFAVVLKTITLSVMSLDDYTIEFGDPTDPRTGFLCNDSNHGFNIDGVWWTTVEHYVLSSQFTDPVIVDEIRESPTVEKARLIARKSGARRLENRIRSANYLIEALRAKFKPGTHLATRLIKTGTANLLCKPLHGSVRSPFTVHSANYLMQIRKELTTTKIPPKPYEYDIIGSQELSDDEIIIVNGLQKLNERVMREEGADRIYHQMVEDSIYSVSRADVVDYITELYKDRKWNSVKKETPMLATVIEQCQDIVGDVKIAASISGFIKWLREKGETTHVARKLRSVDQIKLRLLKKSRPYRSSPKVKVAAAEVDEIKAVVHELTSTGSSSPTANPLHGSSFSEELKDSPKILMKRVTQELGRRPTMPASDIFEIVEQELDDGRTKEKKIKNIKLVKHMSNLDIDICKDGVNIIISGNGVEKLVTKLLSLGGCYAVKKLVSNKTDVIIFSGLALKTNEIKLQKLGAKPRKSNPGIVYIKGPALESKRAKLLKMGGRYPTKTTEVIDTSKIVFPLAMKDKVIMELSSQRHNNARYIVDLASVIAQSKDRKTIQIGDVEAAAKLFRVRTIQSTSDDELADIIDGYRLDDEATEKMKTFNGVVLTSSVGSVPRIEGLSSNEAILVTALRHILPTFNSYPLAVCSLVPRNIRKSVLQFMTTLHSVDSKELQNHGVKYRLKDVSLSAALHILSPKLRQTDYDGIIERAILLLGNVEKVIAPKVTEPKVVAPKVTEQTPKVTEPKVVAPKVTEPTPKVTESKVVAPKVVAPKVTESKVVAPKVVAPKVTESKVVAPKAFSTQYTASDLATDLMRGCIYSEILDINSRNYSTYVQHLESMPLEKRLAAVNFLANCTEEEKNEFFASKSNGSRQTQQPTAMSRTPTR